MPEKLLQRSRSDFLRRHHKEEKKILEALENGKIELSTPSKKEIEAIKATAVKTFKKDKRVTLRLYDHDYKGIQKKAMEMGIMQGRLPSNQELVIFDEIHKYKEWRNLLKGLYDKRKSTTSFLITGSAVSYFCRRDITDITRLRRCKNTDHYLLITIHLNLAHQ